MKKLKKGFTLAEVLITLAIIGIVASIVMPSVMANYQYKTVGVKCSKFATTVENASRAYAVSNGNFTTDDKVSVNDFVNESFIVKELAGTQDSDTLETMGINSEDYPLYYTVCNEISEISTDLPDTEGENADLAATLKDGTSVVISMWDGTMEYSKINTEMTGSPVFNIQFIPNVNGLPITAHKSFNYVVTELGYVYPNPDDDCLWSIYDAGYQTTQKMFSNGAACHVDDDNS